jgi:hypothetical protein
MLKKESTNVYYVPTKPFHPNRRKKVKKKLWRTVYLRGALLETHFGTLQLSAS